MTTRHPRAAESAARAAQLERIKEQRRQARRPQTCARKAYTQSSVHGAAFIAVVPGEPTPPSDRQIVAEIQRLSMGNTMPSPAVYDYARSRSYPTAERVCQLMGMEWREIGIEMGLKPERMRV